MCIFSYFMVSDMQAVYLKSVRSPSFQDVKSNTGRFHLQYNHAVLDVFSQPHAVDTDESQYEKDSFCVGSEEEEEDEGNWKSVLPIIV